MLDSHHPETTAIVHENMRMGIGVTGVLQASETQLSWLDAGYKFLRDFDLQYSDKVGCNPSVKLTTLKPSGTLSLLPGVTPGIHPGYAQYMYRRIRIASDNELVGLCRAHGYPIEYVRNFDGSEDRNTVVVTFPFSYPEGTIVAKDMTAIDQLEWIKRLQTEWSDNSVSCTVYYRKEELPLIREYLNQNYRDTFKSLSFLLHSEHGFEQAPYEEITKDMYDNLVRSTRPIVSVKAADFDSNDECASGACPIK